MGDTMNFPETWEQFLHDYEFTDRLGHYTNGSQLVSSFRVKQMVEHYFEPVKHGRWMGTADGYSDGELVYDMWERSACGYDADGADEKPNWSYCPNCGAKMDAEVSV